MKLSRRTLIASLAATPAACVTPPAPPSPTEFGPMLRGADIKGDIAILRRAYTLLHPGLHRYMTPTQAEARFDQLERDFSVDQPLPQAYLTLSRFLGTVRCGHTYANFFNQSDAVGDLLFKRRTALPFHFRWIGNQMVIEQNLSGDARLVPGTTILEINGVPTPRILQTLLPCARADGSNDDKRRALLEVRGYDRIETFDVFHPLLFPVSPGGIDLRARLPTGATTTATVATHGPDERKAAMRIASDDDAPQWTFAMRGPAGVLTMPNWALYDSKWDWRAWLDARMAELAANAKGLIIDLRGNEGGLDCGNDIIARLIDRDLELTGDERRVRYRQTTADLNPYLDTWDKSFRDWGADASPIDNNFFKLKSETGDTEIIAPKGPRFAGKVVVLIDAQNSSATFQFAQRIQGLKLGTLCGQPTGGNQRGINGGAFFFLRLPDSGLEADLPLIGRFPRTPKPDAGLTPEIRIDLTAANIATGHDRVMETALAAIG